jgi:cytochrome b561
MQLKLANKGAIMAWKNSAARYGSASIALHWVMFALMVGVYATIELHEVYGRTPTGAMFENWHTTLGFAVLVLVIVRLVLRFMQPVPAITPPLARWQHVLAVLVHVALLALMLAMPIIGWVLLSAEGHDVVFLGLPLPALAAPDRAFAETVAEVHEVIGTLGYGLIAVHTAAALFHHYVVKDNTLMRMLPRKSQ